MTCILCSTFVPLGVLEVDPTLCSSLVLSQGILVAVCLYLALFSNVEWFLFRMHFH